MNDIAYQQAAEAFVRTFRAYVQADRRKAKANAELPVGDPARTAAQRAADDAERHHADARNELRRRIPDEG